MHKKDMFVIMPFSGTASCTEAQWTEVFEDVFHPAVKACGYICERAQPTTGSLIKSIVDRLRHARIVLADITDRNANVFYELGVRHAVSRRTIIVAQAPDHIPSDLRGYWSLIYHTNPRAVKKFRSNIKRLITDIETNPERSDSPVSDFLDKEFLSVSAHTQTDNLKKLTALNTELSGNAIILQDLIEDEEAATILISCDSLRLLLQTAYLDFGPDFQKNAYELYNHLRIIQNSDPDMQVLREAFELNRLLSKRVADAKEKVRQGVFEEPPQPTEMTWRNLFASRLLRPFDCVKTSFEAAKRNEINRRRRQT